MLKTLALGPTASELWITAVLPLSSDPPQLGAPPTRIQRDPQGLSSWEDALLTSLGRKGPSVVDLPPVASWSSRGMSLSGGSALTFVAGGRGRRLGGSRGKRESVLLGRWTASISASVATSFTCHQASTGLALPGAG